MNSQNNQSTSLTSENVPPKEYSLDDRQSAHRPIPTPELSTVEQGSPLLSATSPATLQPTVSQKRSLSLFILACACIVIVALAGAGYYLFKPTRADYSDATKIYDKVVTLNNNLEGDLKSIGSFSHHSTNSPKRVEIKNEVDTYTQALTEFKNHKVLRNHNVNKAYQVIVEKQRKAATYLDVLLSSYDDIIAMDEACAKAYDSTFGNSNNVASYMVEYDKVMNPCVGTVKKLSNARDRDISKFAKEYMQKLAQLRAVFEKTATTAYQKDNQANRAAYAELQIINHEEQTMAKAFEETMNKKTEVINLRDELDTFKRALDSERKKAFF